MKKKVLSILFALCLLCACLPLGALAVSADDDVKTYGDLSYRIYDDRISMYYCKRAVSGKVEIPAQIEGLPVVTISSFAFSGCSNITSITIPNSVTTIGFWAFSCCTSLESVTIPDSVTVIRDYAFGYCNSLTSVAIPKGVTRIGSYAFVSCFRLTTVCFSDGIVEIGERAFCGCESLASVTIPTSVETIADDAFTDCPNVTTHAPIGSYAEQYAKQYNIPFVAE